MHFGQNGGQAVSLFNDFWGNEAGLPGNGFLLNWFQMKCSFFDFSVEKTPCYYYSLSISNPSGSFGFFQILPDRACVLSSVAISGSGRPLSPSSWGSEVLFQGRLRHACFLCVVICVRVNISFEWSSSELFSIGSWNVWIFAGAAWGATCCWYQLNSFCRAFR